MAMTSTLKTLIRPSVFATSLNAEPVLPTVQAAIAEYQGENELDRIAKFNTPRILKSGAFQYTVPTKRKNHRFLLASPRALEDLNLKLDGFGEELLSGESFYYDDRIFPYAQAYAGFQFGQTIRVVIVVSGTIRVVIVVCGTIRVVIVVSGTIRVVVVVSRTIRVVIVVSGTVRVTVVVIIVALVMVQSVVDLVVSLALNLVKQTHCCSY
ncbi:hypothetical protein BN1211_5253 [Cyberlindnera jadinii]|uniref:Uncharacterized protein n=1 Tax=Cyberlindnera jadinii (strain ATCC 18201 / CBS 1600 / BCRC 20928 / JCM 3617 / NBRC 0987 / NRRL Y-1542) TaxID=983966 RepID=A0A0H5C7Z7_CYBJN|nr:hypothetical protein BN1211_5253 [Cyberlindnera jadinii]